MPHPKKHSRSGWTGLWATWSRWRCPCSLQQCWTRWPLKVPFNPNNSMMFVFHFSSFVLKIAPHSKCFRFSYRTSKISSIFISAVTKPNKPKKCRHSCSKSFVFNTCLFVHGIYTCCSDKPQRKARWLSLVWKKGPVSVGNQCSKA